MYFSIANCDGVSGWSALVFFISLIFLISAVRCFVHIPADRRKQIEDIEKDKQYAKKLMDDARRSMAEADYKWSLRESSIKREIYAQYDKDLANAIKYEKEKLCSREKEIAAEAQGIREFINQAKNSSPLWLANAITDYEYLRYDTMYNRTQYRTVEKYISTLKSYDRQKKNEMRLSVYKCLYYESLFPFLVDYIDSDFDNSNNLDATTEKDWLSDEEYMRLTASGKSQLALERYIASKSKSKWQIGRDYELYIGYCYRKKGYTVEHFGIDKKLRDLGRDLICHRNHAAHLEILIVQCKCWSSEKKIHEKHITQLYGTTIEYALSKNIPIEKGTLPPSLIPVLITSTELSDTARDFAKALGVKYHENIALPINLTAFPRIKCNKSSGIFHLPFDQQYDTTKIKISEGDEFCFTVAEAESKGYVRAQRYFFNSSS